MSRFAGLRDRAGDMSLRERINHRINRRSLLIGAGAAGGLALAWAVWPRATSAGINANPGEAIFAPFLKIGSDGRIVAIVPQAEMGQGAFTLIPQAIADELGADWRTVGVEPAPISAVYANTLLLDADAALATPRLAVPEAFSHISGWRMTMASSASAMLTDGASDLTMFEAPARECAAFARALLAMAAADRWGVAWEECEAEGGFITHGRRRLRFGELADEAAQGAPPSYPPLRPGRTGALYGQSMPRLDLPGKMDGSTNFAADIRLPHMLYAAIRQGPHGDTRLLRYDRAAGERVAGFLGAVRHERWLASVATNSWAAARALDAMAPRFETRGPLAQTSGVEQRLKAAIQAGEGTRIVARGDVADAMAGRPVVGANYMAAPMLHAQPEPPAATAEPTDDGVRVWFGTQSPGAARAAIAEALGLDAADVTLFTMPVGGNTGAAMHFDVAIQAALIARAMARPVQLSWTRTEDLLRDCPRPAARIALRASLSTGATIDAWHASVATQPARHEWRARLGGASADAARRDAAGASDAAMVSGATPPYLIPNLAVDFVPVDTGLPAGYHRGGADMLTVFAREAFIDELANAAGIDPLSFRISMIGATPELGICLQSVTAMGEWSGGVAGAGQGIACHAMQGSFMAMMAVARQGQNGIIVERLHVSADVGTVLNPTIARQHIENAVAHGLTQAVGLTSKYRRGLAQARRLRDLGLPTLAQMPTIDIQILPSDRSAGSIGDCAATLVAPAIANALFSVTGQRLRRLPLNPRPVD